MKKYIVTAIICLAAGFMAAMLIIIYQGPDMMMMEDQSRFDFERTVSGLEDLAKDRGWSVPTVHNLQKSMEKAGHDVQEVKVIALCNPDHAINILQGDEERVVSSMMPCRVAVYVKKDGKTYLSRMNSKLMSRGMNKNVRITMKSAFDEMEEIISKLVITE
jgi:uncharacterized protein (DUF302 family)